MAVPLITRQADEALSRDEAKAGAALDKMKEEMRKQEVSRKTDPVFPMEEKTPGLITTTRMIPVPKIR